MPFNTSIDELIAQSEAHAAKYRRTLSQDIPKAERDAQNKRDIAMYGLNEAEARAEGHDQYTLFRLAHMSRSESEDRAYDALRRKLRPVFPEAVSFYSRAKVEG
jgi:hypothetical protein